MQHGSLVGVRWTPLPMYRWPTRVPLGCCLAHQYRPSTGEQTGLPNMDTTSALAGALIYVLEERSALLRMLSSPKSRLSCFIMCTDILHSNKFFSLSILWMLWVVKHLNVYVKLHATGQNLSPDSFLSVVFCISVGHNYRPTEEPVTLSFVLNAVHQPVYIICIHWCNFTVTCFWLFTFASVFYYLFFFTFLLLCFIMAALSNR